MSQTESKIEYMEAFDCDVELALDQITDDEQIRGKIRFMLVTLTEEHHSRARRTTGKFEDEKVKLKQILDLTRDELVTHQMISCRAISSEVEWRQSQGSAVRNLPPPSHL